MTVLSQEEFETRELITTIVLSNGEEVQVRLPVMADVVPLLQWAGKSEFVMFLVCASINWERERFLKLNYIDGMKLVEPVGQMQNAVNAYATNMQIQKPEVRKNTK